MTNNPRTDVSPIPSARPPFYDEVFARAYNFAEDLLRLCPEVEAIAIVPSWQLEEVALPAGMVKYRDQNYQLPAVVCRMARQLATLQRNLAERGLEQAVGLQTRVRQLQEEINALQEVLPANPGGPPAGDAPAGSTAQPAAG